MTAMQYTMLGKTGLRVSVAGLGLGGNSRIGQGTGLSQAQSVGLIREAYDQGVNFFDTAEAYGTEEILGAAFSPAERSKVVISTKSRIQQGANRLTPAEVVANLETSLKKLKTDNVDVFLLHGVAPDAYDYARNELAPALLKEKAKGKLKHFGLSESSPLDPEQKVLQRAVADPTWEVAMLAYHMMNQGARRDVFPKSRQSGLGTLMMFVVRNVFSKPQLLAETMAKLAAEGKVPAEMGRSPDPLGFLVHEGGASSLIDAAYRFARHEPGCDVVLFGTGSSAHLKSNIASILAPPLPPRDVARLHELFSHLRGVGLDFPDRMKAPGKG